MTLGLLAITSRTRLSRVRRSLRVLLRRLDRDSKNRSQAAPQSTCLVALVVPVLWTVSSARAATALSQSMPPSRYSRSWATASSISRAFLLAQMMSSLVLRLERSSKI